MKAPKQNGAASARIPPNPKLLITALRSIGYSFEQAIADVVDNAVSAGAKDVLVRLIRSEDRVRF